jgi:hypothetical protein
MTFQNSNENVMYEAVTETNDPSYLVTLDQIIYDIVGEEDWIHGESNCLVNLASGRTITLSWGAKKKGKKSKEEYYLMKICKLTIRLLLEIMVFSGHTKLK